MIHSTYQLCC